jgi:hypothetical protein
MSNFQNRKHNLVVNRNSRVLFHLQSNFSPDVRQAVFPACPSQHLKELKARKAPSEIKLKRNLTRKK